MRCSRLAVVCGLTALIACGDGRASGSGAQAGGAGTAPAPAGREALIWRTTRNCGVNCLYVLLRTNGKSVDYEDLMNDLHARCSGEQNSLTDLRHAARDRGLRCQLGKTTLEGLKSLPKPVIAHTEKATPDSGHFVLVVNVGPETVEIMDGTTGSITAVSQRDFEQSWTGYVLYASPPWYATIPWWGYAMLAVALGVAVSWIVGRLWRGRKWAARPSVVPHEADLPASVAPSKT
jgi:hypothetical protein